MNNLKKYAGLLNEEAPENHFLAYITPGERDMLVDAGGVKTPTPSGIFAYPPGYGGGGYQGGSSNSSSSKGGGPAGGASAGGNYGGNSSGGVSANNMSGASNNNNNNNATSSSSHNIQNILELLTNEVSNHLTSGGGGLSDSIHIELESHPILIQRRDEVQSEQSTSNNQASRDGTESS